MRQPDPETAEFRTSFLALLAPPETRLRIHDAAAIADLWLSLTVGEREGPVWTRRWRTTEQYEAWLVSRWAAHRAVVRDWLARRALDGLLRLMFPRWRRPHGFVDTILVPHRMGRYEWVIDAILAELADPEMLDDELGGRLEVADALDVLRGTWTSISAARQETR